MRALGAGAWGGRLGRARSAPARYVLARGEQPDPLALNARHGAVSAMRSRCYSTHGATVTGIALRMALPETGSSPWSDTRRFMFTPECSAATRICDPDCPCPQPCGRLTTPGIIASVTRTGAVSDATEEVIAAGAPSTSP